MEIFSAQGVADRHIVTHTAVAERVRGIDADRAELTARGWRTGHLAAYRAALGRLGDHAEISDTMARSPREAAWPIAARGGLRAPYAGARVEFHRHVRVSLG